MAELGQFLGVGDEVVGYQEAAYGKQGVHPRVVMETLGHSQIALTMNTLGPAVELRATG